MGGDTSGFFWGAIGFVVFLMGMFIAIRGAKAQREVRKKNFENTNDAGVVQVNTFEEGERRNADYKNAGCVGQIGALFAVGGLVVFLMGFGMAFVELIDPY